MVVEHDREELVETLRHELALRNREIARLHEVVASQAHAIAQATTALPATVPTREAEQPSSPRTDAAGIDDRETRRETAWERLRRLFTG